MYKRQAPRTSAPVPELLRLWSVPVQLVVAVRRPSLPLELKPDCSGIPRSPPWPDELEKVDPPRMPAWPFATLFELSLSFPRRPPNIRRFSAGAPRTAPPLLLTTLLSCVPFVPDPFPRGRLALEPLLS